MKNEDGNEANHEKLLSTAIIMRWDVRACVCACISLFRCRWMWWAIQWKLVGDPASQPANDGRKYTTPHHSTPHTHNAKSAFYWASFWFDSKFLLPFKWISLKNNLFVSNGNWLCSCLCYFVYIRVLRTFGTSECVPPFFDIYIKNVFIFTSI